MSNKNLQDNIDIPNVPPSIKIDLITSNPCDAKQIDGFKRCTYPDGDCLLLSGNEISGRCIMPKSKER